MIVILTILSTRGSSHPNSTTDSAAQTFMKTLTGANYKSAASMLCAGKSAANVDHLTAQRATKFSPAGGGTYYTESHETDTFYYVTQAGQRFLIGIGVIPTYVGSSARCVSRVIYNPVFR